MATASILTIGNELVSGDVPNTNASWLAKRLAPLGVSVRMLAAVPDEIEQIAEFVRDEAPRVDFLLVTGGLGGTPDDLTREAIAHAFGVEQVEEPDVAADLRTRFEWNPDYAVRWAQLPEGSRPLLEPARRRARLRDRERLRPARSPGGDGGDVRCDRGGVQERQSDRDVAAVVQDA